MVLGAVWAPTESTRTFNNAIRQIKQNYGLASHIEVKWGKISPKSLPLYIELVTLFFQSADLHFRSIVIPDKRLLDHKRFDQDHDQWYYKMYFRLLEQILTPTDEYAIYLDIKDTLGGIKVANLKKVLSNSQYDFSSSIVQRVQVVRSHEIQLLQIADILIGAVSSANRSDTTSVAKQQIVALVKSLSGYSLTRTTLLREPKFNILRWTAA